MNATRNSPLIESDRVEGTTVYAMGGERVGTVRRMLIEKVGGRVVYAVVAFEALADVAAEDQHLPWGMLRYDTDLGGYRAEISASDMRQAPRLAPGQEHDWRDHEEQLNAFFRIPPYSRAI